MLQKDMDGKRESPHERARLLPLGDSALVVTFGDEIDEATHFEVRAFSDHLAAQPPEAMIEHIPAFTSVTVLYDPIRSGYEDFAGEIQALIEDTPKEHSEMRARTVEIPVCYGGDLGPDLDFVASHNGLTTDEVIAIHCGPTYPVYMIGFAPGFPYLGGMSAKIAAPRRDAPRERIPAGSVGLAGKQTGIYPIETPGGWQVIGRTPLRLFRPDENPPSLLRAGDRVRFNSVDRADYDRILDGVE
jgi:inhibitor of KinA